MVDNALVVADIRKTFGQVPVLKGISVEAAVGEFLVLVGPSGCGKSTLLNCIAGLEDVTSGTITIAGRDVTEVAPKDRDIAMVFQSYALYPTMSVGENIGFGMKIRNRPQAEIDSRVGDVARLLKIDHLLDRRPSQLSGGQRQRVAMGRALVREPSLFLFDEPLSNLDAKLRVEMRAEIKRLHQETGTTIVYVTHDQIEAMTLATKIVVLKDGEVQQIGTPEEIYHNPQNAFVADFMGSPPMNLIEADLDPKASALTFSDGQSLAVNKVPTSIKSTTRVRVGVRPEEFGEGTALTVSPTLIEHTGSDVFLTFELGGTPVTARLSGRSHVGGSSVKLDVDLTHACYFDLASGHRLV